VAIADESIGVSQLIGMHMLRLPPPKSMPMLVLMIDFDFCSYKRVRNAY